MNRLSTLNREQNLYHMSKEKLDLLVIGGGITGAGIALDASHRGLKIGLIEKQDFSAGTSSRSTKLIHGGLRYLKQGEIRLVQEVGRERAILYRHAPHIVKPEKMLLPIVKGGTYGKLLTSFALRIYDLLAGVKKEERRKMLTKDETVGLEPLLRRDILKGGGLYYEYQTDDARLTIEVLKTAVAKGAIAVNYTEADEFIYENGKVVGVEAKDLLTEKKYKIHAKKTVNATGPWVDQLRNKDKSLNEKRLHLTKGVHLVFPHKSIPLNHSIYFDVPDGRMIFAIPKDNTTYVGTTDTDYKGSLENPRITKDDVKYLLDATNQMFPKVHLTENDIISSWAGLRPLIHEDGKAPSELSRKDEIFYSPTGLITIAGGKLTGFRKMAERVVDQVIKELEKEEKKSYKECTTDKIILSGGDFFGDDEIKDLEIPSKIDSLINEIACTIKSREIYKEQIRHLVRKYGTNAKRIIKIAKEHAEHENDDGLVEMKNLLIAEIRYTIEHEMVTNLDDFFSRRTSQLFFERNTILEIYPTIVDEMGGILSWSNEDKQRYIKRFTEIYNATLSFNHPISSQFLV